MIDRTEFYALCVGASFIALVWSIFGGPIALVCVAAMMVGNVDVSWVERHGIDLGAQAGEAIPALEPVARDPDRELIALPAPKKAAWSRTDDLKEKPKGKLRHRRLVGHKPEHGVPAHVALSRKAGDSATNVVPLKVRKAR